jgi:hypothetical protein
MWQSVCPGDLPIQSPFLYTCRPLRMALTDVDALHRATFLHHIDNIQDSQIMMRGGARARIDQPEW